MPRPSWKEVRLSRWYPAPVYLLRRNPNPPWKGWVTAEGFQ